MTKPMAVRYSAQDYYEDMREFADLALKGAHEDWCHDKSTWIRIWVFARKRCALPHDSQDWKEAYEASRGEEQP